MLTLLLATCAALAGPADRPRERAVDVDVAWHGDALTHPGVMGRLGVPLTTSDRLALVVEAETGVWWHPGNLVAVPVQTGLLLRRTGSRGALVGAFAHGGLLAGVHARRALVVQDGAVSTPAALGRAWLRAVGGVELGHTVRRGPIDAWYVRPQLGLRAPTLHGVGWDPAVQVGARFGRGGVR